MKSLGEVLRLSTEFLSQKKCTRARRIAEELLAHIVQIGRLDLYMQFDRPMEDSELETLRSLLKKASTGEPIDYILGKISFYHCTMQLTPAVLIPRPETEILVDMACKEIGKEVQTDKIAWDLCTGSGCIGIAVKKACPEVNMALSDISESALDVAKSNASLNQAQVQCVLGDLLTPFKEQKAHIVFCNPPYISHSSYQNLDPSVKNFEPKEALLAGEDGLLFYRRLKEELPDFLHAGAKIYLEIGYDQGKAVMELFSTGPWKKCRLEKDWAGHDRFFFLEFE